MLVLNTCEEIAIHVAYTIGRTGFKHSSDCSFPERGVCCQPATYGCLEDEIAVLIIDR